MFYNKYTDQYFKVPADLCSRKEIRTRTALVPEEISPQTSDYTYLTAGAVRYTNKTAVQYFRVRDQNRSEPKVRSNA